MSAVTKLSSIAGSHIRPIADIALLPQLTLDVWGPEQSGKTDFALSAAGSKGMFYQSTEIKSLDGVVQKYADKPVYVGIYESDIPHTLDRTQHTAVQEHFKRALKRLKLDYDQALQAKAGVIVHDKSLGVWEIMRLAYFGKLEGVTAKNYGPLNIEFADLLDQGPKHGTSLILINEETEEWGPSADGKSRQTTGRTVRKGQDRTGFLVDASLRMFRVGKPPKFFCEIVEARKSPELIGTVIENPRFLEVATMLKPEIDWQEVLGL